MYPLFSAFSSCALPWHCWWVWRCSTTFFHQTKAEVAFFYLVGLVSCCIFIYVFFTYVNVYIAYVCLVAYAAGCIRWLCKPERYPYVCGACGAKLRTKGICPHCGALNE